MSDMPADIEIDIWESVFEQTPLVWRWVFGVLTLGLFTLATQIYRINKANMQRIEQQLKEQLEKTERQLHARMDRNEAQTNSRLDEVNTHLIQIARNTSRTREDNGVYPSAPPGPE